MQYKVSIVVPIYNVENYLENCLESLVNQTLSNIQVIMLNDGSPDNSVHIAEQYEEKYENFKLINKENTGLAGTRNVGLEYVEGEYVLFLDSDDQLTPQACEVLVKEADKYQADIILGRSVWKYPNGKEKPVEYLERWYDKTKGKNQASNQEIAVGVPIATSKLFRTKLIKDNKIKFPTGITGEDVVFSVYTYHHAKAIYIIPDIIYWRTERNEENNLSITQQKSVKIVKDRIQVIKLVDAYCRAHGLSFVNEHCKKSTYIYTMQTIQGLCEEEQVQAYTLLLEFIKEEFTDLSKVKSYIGIGYSELRIKAKPIKNKHEYPLYNNFKVLESTKINKDIKISIILPIYNVEDYLEESISSILNQTMNKRYIEVIMVDDGSKDETGLIMEELCSRYDNFKAIYLGKGSGAAGKPRNVGLEYASGKYIMYLDPDDKFVPKACEKLYKLAEKNKSDICIGKFQLFNSSRQWGNHYFPPYRIYRTHIDRNRELLNLPPAIWSKLYRREFLVNSNISYPEGVIAQDAVFNIETLLRANAISYLPEVVTLYRIREDETNKSITQKFNERYFKDYIYTRKLIMEIYNKFSKCDYMKERMRIDIDFLFRIFIESDLNEICIEKMVEIILPYVQLIEEESTSLTSDKKLFIKLVKNKAYSQLEEIREYSLIVFEPLDNCKNKDIDYRREYNRLANSHSWKLTSHLRNFKRKLMK